MSYKRTVYMVLLTSFYAATASSVLKFSVFNHDGGFFSWFKGAIGFLNFFEKNKKSGRYEGAEIFFTGGPYFEQERGQNWWEYYFEPISLLPDGSKTTTTVTMSLAKFSIEACKVSFSRQLAHSLISKYIRLKPDIQNEVDAYVQNNFEGYFVIGIHYRGTDKSDETIHISRNRIYSELEALLKHAKRECKIFVATDEQDFLEEIERKYDVVIALPMQRSSNGVPLHLGNQLVSPYTRGKEALLDCLLLAKSDIMIVWTQSNLSSAASDFNPNMPVVILNNPRPDLR